MQLVVRADGNAAMGTGHVMRCFALAQAWRDRGGDVTFRSAGLPEPLVKLLVDEGIALSHVAEAPGSLADVRATAALCAAVTASWLVVDGYHLDTTFEAEGSVPVLRVDDRPIATSAAYFLNQNLGAKAHAGVRDALLGPQFALLRREFRRSAPKMRSANHVTAVVTFGGADPKGLGQRWLTQAPMLPDVRFLFVIGGANPRRDALMRAAASCGNVDVFVAASDMVPLLDRADFAISAAGSTLWELAARRVPAVLIAAAEVEVPSAVAVANAGAAIYLGKAEEVSDPMMADAIARLAVDADLRCRMVDATSSITDGLGADRTVDRLLGAR